MLRGLTFSASSWVRFAPVRVLNLRSISLFARELESRTPQVDADACGNPEPSTPTFDPQTTTPSIPLSHASSAGVTGAAQPVMMVLFGDLINGENLEP
jgi:hypothetical protein